MDVRQLIEKELRFARYECQLKFRAAVSEEQLLHAGAKELGSTTHEDHYYRPRRGAATTEMIRVRVEGGERLFFTYRDGTRRKNHRGHMAVHKLISDAELRDLCKDHEQILTIHKRRTIYLLGNVIINLDEVERLGVLP